MALAAVCAALTAVLAQVAIPTPSGVPLTFQTLAVALTGCLLGPRGALMSVFAYVLLGACGVPVFASFGAGAGQLLGVTGGFLWGFFPMGALSGVGARMKGRAAGLLLCLAGGASCHALGVIQFALVSGRRLSEAFLLTSLPYLVKDALSVVAALYLAQALQRRLARRK